MMILWHVNAQHFAKTCNLTQKLSTLFYTHPIIQFLITHKKKKKLIFIFNISITYCIVFQLHVKNIYYSFYIHLHILDLKMHIKLHLFSLYLFS
jgi:hypothetical protein